MGETTGIAWADASMNFWIGCEEVSPGCKNCYAKRLVTGRMAKPFWPPWRTSPANWAGPAKWVEPKNIFTCSLSDFFLDEPNVNEWRVEAWRIIRKTSWHRWLILTKRPEDIRRFLPDDWGEHGYGNVWLGTSVELQRPYAEHRISELLRIPAPVHFVSAEPLLGPLDLTGYLGPDKVNWVIVGGESQPGARPMDPEWARSLRDQCQYHHAAYFLKQLGGYPNPRDHEQAVLDGRTHTEMPGNSGGT